RDRSLGLVFEATYDDVINQERIRYTMPDGRGADTTLVAEDGATQAPTVADAESVQSTEHEREGWQAILDECRSYAAKQHPQGGALTTMSGAFPNRRAKHLSKYGTPSDE